GENKDHVRLQRKGEAERVIGNRGPDGLPAEERAARLAERELIGGDELIRVVRIEQRNRAVIEKDDEELLIRGQQLQALAEFATGPGEPVACHAVRGIDDEDNGRALSLLVEEGHESAL